MNSNRATRLLPVMAVAFVVSAAFACMAADSSDADFADYRNGAYVGVSGTYDQICSLCGGDDFFSDTDAICYIFSSSVYSSSCSITTTADKVSLERSKYSELVGDTYVYTEAQKVTMSNVTVDRVMTSSVVNNIFAGQEYSSDGLGQLQLYLTGLGLDAGVEIECTISNYYCEKLVSYGYTYQKCGSGYLISQVSYLTALNISGDFVYTITSGIDTRTFTVSLNNSTYLGYSDDYEYTSTEPETGKDLCKEVLAANCLDFSENSVLTFNGYSYGLHYIEMNASYWQFILDDGTALLDRTCGVWYSYDGSGYISSLPSAAEYEYTDLLKGLTDDDKVSESTIKALGGTINKDADYAEYLGDSIVFSSSSGYNMLYIGIAVIAVIAVIVIAAALWMTRSKNRGAA